MPLTRFAKNAATHHVTRKFARPPATAAMFRLLTAKRWELIERLQSIGSTTVRGLARELDRDVKRVHGDVTTLIKYGLVARTADRKICVPYDVIHGDFDLRAVA